MRLTLLTSIIVLCAAGSLAGTETVTVDLACQLDFPEEEVLLVDPRENDLPDELTGVLHTEGEFYLYDLVTERLLVMGCDGTERFRYGSKGSGPEDHYTHCDPLLWQGKDPVLIDYALPPKIIRLTADGGYGGSFALETPYQIVRLLWAGDRALGVEVVPRRDDDGNFIVAVRLVTFDADGALIRRLELDVHELDLGPGSDRSAEALEMFPRLACRGDRIFMQQDVYSFTIECMDLDLERIWRYGEDTKLIRDPDPFVHKGLRGVAPTRYFHPIRSMWARADGGLWIEVETGEGPAEERRYRCLNATGERTDDVVVTGLPAIPGTLSYAEDDIVWSDINVESVQGARSVRKYHGPR